MTILYIIIYLIGCVLAYGKLVAMDYEECESSERKPIPWWETLEGPLVCVVIATSFVGYLVFVILGRHFLLHKYWFKWSYKPLYKRWRELNENKSQ